MACSYLSGNNYCELMAKSVFADECPCIEFKEINVKEEIDEKEAMAISY